MKKELDARFVIDEKSTNKEEYIKVINDFINSHEGFRPEETNYWKKDKLRYRFNHSFVTKYKCVLLDETYFTNGKSIDTSHYMINVCYSEYYKRNVVLIYHRWGNRETFILGEEHNELLSITFLRTLYRKLVVNIIDYANLTRRHKINKDIMTFALNKKFHFNKRNGRGEIFGRVTHRAPNQVEIVTKKFGVSNGKIVISQYNDSQYYTVDSFAQKFHDSVHSDDFETTIMPLMGEIIQKQIEGLNDKNNTAMETIKSLGQNINKI